MPPVHTGKDLARKQKHFMFEAIMTSETAITSSVANFQDHDLNIPKFFNFKGITKDVEPKPSVTP